MQDDFLPSIGFIRLNTVLKYIPISKTAWFKGIKQGIYPKPIKLSTRSSAWDVVLIRQLIADLGGQVEGGNKDTEATDGL